MRIAVVALIIFLIVISTSIAAYAGYSALRRTVEGSTYDYYVINVRALGLYRIYWFKPINGSYLFVIGRSSTGVTYILLDIEGRLIYKNTLPPEYYVEDIVSVSANSRLVSIIYSISYAEETFYLCIIDIVSGEIIENKLLPRVYYKSYPKIAISDEGVLVYSAIVYLNYRYKLIVYFEKIGSQWNYTLDFPNNGYLLSRILFVGNYLFIHRTRGSDQYILILAIEDGKPVITYNLSYTLSILRQYYGYNILYTFSPNNNYLAVSYVDADPVISVILDLRENKAVYYTLGIGDWVNEYYVSNGIFYDTSGVMAYYYGYDGYLTISAKQYLITLTKYSEKEVIVVHRIEKINEDNLITKLVEANVLEDTSILINPSTLHIDKENNIIGFSEKYDEIIYLLKFDKLSKSIKYVSENSSNNSYGFIVYAKEYLLKTLFIIPAITLVVLRNKNRKFIKVLILLSLVLSIMYIPLLNTSNNVIEGPTIHGRVIETSVYEDGFIVIYKNITDNNYYLALVSLDGSLIDRYFVGDDILRYAGYIGDKIYFYNTSKSSGDTGFILQLYTITGRDIVYVGEYKSIILKSIYGSNILLKPSLLRIINGVFTITYTGVNGSASIVVVEENGVRRVFSLKEPIGYSSELTIDYRGFYVSHGSSYGLLRETMFRRSFIVLKGYRDKILLQTTLMSFTSYGLADSIQLLSLKDSRIVTLRLFPVIKATLEGIEYVRRTKYYPLYTSIYIDDGYAVIPYYDIFGEKPVIGVAKTYFDGRIEYSETVITFKPSMFSASCYKDVVLFTLYDQESKTTRTYLVSLGDMK